MSLGSRLCSSNQAQVDRAELAGRGLHQIVDRAAGAATQLSSVQTPSRPEPETTGQALRTQTRSMSPLVDFLFEMFHANSYDRKTTACIPSTSEVGVKILKRTLHCCKCNVIDLRKLSDSHIGKPSWCTQSFAKTNNYIHWLSSLRLEWVMECCVGGVEVWEWCSRILGYTAGPSPHPSPAWPIVALSIIFRYMSQSRLNQTNQFQSVQIIDSLGEKNCNTFVADAYVFNYLCDSCREVAI